MYSDGVEILRGLTTRRYFDGGVSASLGYMDTKLFWTEAGPGDGVYFRGAIRRSPG